MPSTISRLENYHRWQILLQAPAAEPIQALLTRLRRQSLPGAGVQVVVDVDPVNLM